MSSFATAARKVLVIGFLFPFTVSAVSLDEIKKAAGESGISTVGDIPTVILRAIAIILQFTGGIAVLFILIGGFQYIIARGNDEAMEKAKKTLTGAVIGFILSLLAYTIVQGIRNLIVGSGV
jgi:hypothetical protein